MKEEGVCMAVDTFLGMEGGREEVEGDHDISVK